MSEDKGDSPYLNDLWFPGGVMLNVGSGNRPNPECINVDFQRFPGVDVVASLEKPWPFKSDSIDFIDAADVLEHMRICYEEPDPELFDLGSRHLLRAWRSEGDERVESLLIAVDYIRGAMRRPKRTYGTVHFMNEARRILKPGGILRIFSPDTRGYAWAQDPTHVSFLNLNSFLYYLYEDWRRTHGGLIEGLWELEGAHVSEISQNAMSWIRVILKKPDPPTAGTAASSPARTAT